MAGNHNSGQRLHKWDEIPVQGLKVFFYDTDADYKNLASAASAFRRRHRWCLEIRRFHAIGCLVVFRRW